MSEKAWYQRICINIKPFCAIWIKLWGGLAAVLGVIFVFFDWSILGVADIRCRFDIFALLMAAVTVCSLLRVCTVKKRKVFGNTNNSVSVQYGDLLEIGFPEKVEEKRIVVIPVNRCFDLSCEDNLVTPNSIHGKWLKRYVKTESDRKKLAQLVKSALRKYTAESETLPRSQKLNGNLKRYQPGTIVEVPGENNVVFYLLALAAYKNDLEVTCSESEFYQVVQSLVDYHRTHGQGNPLYCPIMCDHIVQPPKDSSEVLDLILAILKYNKDSIHGKVHVVVYDKMMEDVSISGY